MMKFALNVLGTVYRPPTSRCGL